MPTTTGRLDLISRTSTLTPTQYNPMVIDIRPAVVDDAAALTALYRENRAFLEPWEPVRDDSFYTLADQRRRLENATAEREAGSTYRCVIEEDGRIVGTIGLSAIERGPAQSTHLGYWVAQAANGRGIATAATGQVLQRAFGELGLHRVQAGTLLHNTGSQRVLERNGFERIGVARSYLKIAGEWQDHVLFQRVAD